MTAPVRLTEVGKTYGTGDGATVALRGVSVAFEAAVGAAGAGNL